jgi:hypothetical protein
MLQAFSPRAAQGPQDVPTGGVLYCGYGECSRIHETVRRTPVQVQRHSQYSVRPLGKVQVAGVPPSHNVEGKAGGRLEDSGRGPATQQGLDPWLLSLQTG